MPSHRVMSEEERARREIHAKDEELSRAILALDVDASEAYKAAGVLMAGYQKDALHIGENDVDGDNSIDVDEWMSFWPPIFGEYFDDEALVNPICQRIFEIIDWNQNKSGTLKLIHITNFMNKAKKRRHKLKDFESYLHQVKADAGLEVTPTPPPPDYGSTEEKESGINESARIEELLAEIEKLKVEIETHTSTIATMTSTDSELRAQIEVLKQQVSSNDGRESDELSRLREEVERLTRENESQSTTIITMTTSESQLREEIDQLRAELDGRKSADDDEMAKLREEVERLKQENEGQSSTITAMTSSQSEMEREIQELRGQLTNKNSSASAEMDELRREIERLKLENESQSNALTALTSSEASARADLETCESTRAQIQADMDSMRQEIEKLRQENQSQLSSIVALTSSESSLRAELLEVRASNQQVSQELTETKRKLGTCEEHGREMTSLIEHLRAENEKLRLQTEQQRETISAMSSENERVVAQVQVLQAQVGDGDGDFSGEEKSALVVAMEKEIEMLKKQVGEKEDKIGEQVREIHEVQVVVNDKTDEIERLKREIEELKAERTEILQRGILAASGRSLDLVEEEKSKYDTNLHVQGQQASTSNDKDDEMHALMLKDQASFLSHTQEEDLRSQYEDKIRQLTEDRDMLERAVTQQSSTIMNMKETEKRGGPSETEMALQRQLTEMEANHQQEMARLLDSQQSHSIKRAESTEQSLLEAEEELKKQKCCGCLLCNLACFCC